MTHVFARSVLVAALIVVSGCGSSNPRPVVKGSVTYKGRPASYQTLTLLPAQADQKFMRRVYLNDEGRFEGDAPGPGEYKVVIDLPMAALEGNANVPGVDVKIPDKYRKIETTDLRWTIVAGLNEKDFVLAD
jgi:hypothetical protein